MEEVIFKNEKVKKIFEKLKKDKKALLIVVTGILGMLLILFSGIDTTEKNGERSINEADVTIEHDVLKELTELLESIDGAGETKVMITYKSAEETVYAVDTDENSDGEEASIKREHIIIETSQGEGGLPVKIIFPEVQGVAVICEGGDDPIVREKIYTVLTALFDISTNRISVAAMA